MKKTAALCALILCAATVRATITNSVLTIDLSNKTVSASAIIAIRETINVALVNIGTSDPGNLILRIVKGTNAYASASSFTSAGTNTNGVVSAFGALDLNTSELVDAYKGLNPTSSKQWSIAVWDTTLGALLVNDFINIQNNPYDPSMPGPSPVGVSYVLTNDSNYVNSVTGFTYRTQGNVGMVEKTDARNARITFPSPEAATGTVVSVNGEDGVVILDTSDIGEGTNLYYTETRVAANSSVTNALALATAAYPASNPSNFVDASVTNALSLRVDGMTNGVAAGLTAVQPTDSDYTNTAALAASALQEESDPNWEAVSNTVVSGAALGATAVQVEADPNWATVSNAVVAGAASGASAVQPTDSNYTNAVALAGAAVQPTDSDYTNAIALAGSALQSGAAGTSTNLADYNNDAGFLTSADAAPIQSVFGRTGVVVGVAGDYADIYSPTGHVHVIGDTTGLQDALDGKSSTSAVALVEAKADQGVTAYGWGNHALAGYLTTAGTRFDSMTVADVTEISSNISGLTDGTYTGSVTTVSFTGTTATVQNRVYVWGFTKQNNYGTGALTLAGADLSATSSGTVSNYFVALTTNTDLVLRIDGTGSAKSDVSNVFVREVTNGTLTAVLVQAPAAEFERAYLAPGGTTGQVWTLTDDVTGEGAWGDAGAGDMLKAVYDTDDNSKVDAADDSDALGGVAAAGYATTGALAGVQGEVVALSNTVTNLTAVQRYQACDTSGKEVNIIATKAGVTASWAGSVLTFDNGVGAIIDEMEIRWPNASGDSFDVVLGTNGLAHTGVTARFVMNGRAWNEESGTPITGANARPDPDNFDTVNVLALSGATSYIIKLD